MRSSIFIVLILFGYLNSFSQNRTQDSLYYLRISETTKRNIKEGKFLDNILILKTEIVDNKYSTAFKSKIYNDIAANFGMSGKIDSALYYTEKAIMISDKMKLKNLDYYNSLINKSNILYSKGHLTEALKINYSIVEYFKKSNVNRYLNILITIGTILIDIKSFDDASNYLNMAEDEGQKNKNFEALYRVYHNKAQLRYYKNRRFTDNICIEHGTSALEMAEKTNKANLIADAKTNLGTYYWKIGKLPEAISLLTSADSFYTARNVSKTSLYTSLSKAYYSIGDYEKSKYYFEKINNNSLKDLDKIEHQFLAESIKNQSPFYNIFIQYKTTLDSIVAHEVDQELLTLDKKFKLLEKDNEIRKLNENYLTNKVEVQKLIVENLKQASENDKVLVEKSKVEYNLKQNEYIQSESQRKILNLELVQTTKQATISAQKNYLIGGSLGLILVSLLSFFLYKQKEKQQLLNRSISQQKDQIQLLNRELNHRVKNNLAFMTSLLEMQGRRTESAEAKQVLSESETRLKALALVHSQLFRSENDVDINLKTYINEVLDHLKNIFSIPHKQLKIQSDLIDYQVNAEDAMRLGLIINESVTNSVKHAFLDVKNPNINIKTSVNHNGKLVMEYQDNGPGIETILQKDGVSNSLGLKLISLLKKQLGDRYVVMV